MEKEIYDLQIKISFLEDFINNLNGVVIEQNEENEKLKREMVKLKNKISQLEERMENRDDYRADELPPHY